MIRSSCLVCGAPEINRVIDLGMHPFADSFIPETRLSDSEPVYPLQCDLCPQCGSLQAAHITDPTERYSNHDYSYTSSNSRFARDHWDEYPDQVSAEARLRDGSLIVEVGSNDGYLAERFQSRGQRVLGVDPSPYMSGLARERGVETVVDLFGPSCAERIREAHGPAQLVIGNNVLNHSNDPVAFARAAAGLLNKTGCFVFELPYWLCGLRDGKFDQIYHEHVTYFTVRSAAALLQRAGLAISKVELVDYHGGSLRVFAKHADQLSGPSEAATEMIIEETRAGAFDPWSYAVFVERICQQRHLFLRNLYDIKARGIPIVAVGAAAKGNTFLNFYNLDSTVIDFVTDSSPHKQDKYTPLTRIPICGDEVFADYGEVFALILSWNISDFLRENLSRLNPSIKFLSLPDPTQGEEAGEPEWKSETSGT